MLYSETNMVKYIKKKFIDLNGQYTFKIPKLVEIVKLLFQNTFQAFVHVVKETLFFYILFFKKYISFFIISK